MSNAVGMVLTTMAERWRIASGTIPGIAAGAVVETERAGDELRFIVPDIGAVMARVNMREAKVATVDGGRGLVVTSPSINVRLVPADDAPEREAAYDEALAELDRTLASGREAYFYDSIYMPVDSMIDKESMADSFDVGPLRAKGFGGWEIVGVVPRTVATTLTNYSLGMVAGRRGPERSVEPSPECTCSSDCE